MFKTLHSTARLAHQFLETRLGPGSAVIDATAGNGNDTLYLAGKVAPGGIVYAFDIQEQAIRATTDLVLNNGLSDVVRIIHAGHEAMREYVQGPVDAIIFNLGYLPGGDHNIVTSAATTVTAVDQGLGLLKPGGLMCIVVYTGHPGGEKEQQVLESHLQELGKKNYCVGRLDFLNRTKAPYLLIIEKDHGEPGGVSI